ARVPSPLRSAPISMNALTRAHRPNQTSVVQRSPRLSRGMTTGTSAPESPPRSSRATSPHPETTSLIELMPWLRMPRPACSIICSATVLTLVPHLVLLSAVVWRGAGLWAVLGWAVRPRLRLRREALGRRRWGLRLGAWRHTAVLRSTCGRRPGAAARTLQLGTDGLVGDRSTDLVEHLLALGVADGLGRRDDLDVGGLGRLQQVPDLALASGDPLGDLGLSRPDRLHVLVGEELVVLTAHELAGDLQVVHAVRLAADPHDLRQGLGEALHLVEHVLLVAVVEDLRRQRRAQRPDVEGLCLQQGRVGVGGRLRLDEALSGEG